MVLLTRLHHAPTALLQSASHSCFTAHVFSSEWLWVGQVMSCVKQITTHLCPFIKNVTQCVPPRRHGCDAAG